MDIDDWSGWFLLLVSFCINLCLVETTNQELQLRSYLFDTSRYSPYVIPRDNVSENVVIEMEWTLIRLNGLYEKDSRLSQDISIQLTWTDEYLTWDPQSYGGIKSFSINGEDIWTPDLQIYNRIASGFLKNGLSAEKVKIMSNGTVQVSPFGDLDTICNVDPVKFPVDCHRCNIPMGANTVSERQIFRWGTPGFIEFGKGEHPYWDINKASPAKRGPMTSLDMEFKRVPQYYIFNIVLPASTLSFFGIIAFFIPIEVGERLGYVMVIFLSFMVLMMHVGGLIPETSRSSPAIGKYFLLLMGASLISIVNSVVISYFSNKPEQSNDNKVSPITTNDKPFSDDGGRRQKKSFDKHCKYCFLKLRNYLTPLKVVNLLSFAACFIICLYAHVALFLVLGEDTCAAITDELPKPKR